MGEYNTELLNVSSDTIPNVVCIVLKSRMTIPRMSPAFSMEKIPPSKRSSHPNITNFIVTFMSLPTSLSATTTAMNTTTNPMMCKIFSEASIYWPNHPHTHPEKRNDAQAPMMMENMATICSVSPLNSPWMNAAPNAITRMMSIALTLFCYKL